MPSDVLKSAYEPFSYQIEYDIESEAITSVAGVEIEIEDTLLCFEIIDPDKISRFQVGSGIIGSKGALTLGFINKDVVELYNNLSTN